MERIEAVTVEALRVHDGWELRLNIAPALRGLCTKEEQARLFEKMACTASDYAARIRQDLAGEGK